MFCLINKSDIQELPKGISHQLIYENDSAFFFPRHIRRYYDYSYIKLWRDSKFVIKRPKKFNFVSTLRDEQVNVYNDIIESCRINGYLHGIVKARPAFGKTLLGIYLAHKFNLVTLFVINNKKIIEQWVEEIIVHTDLSKDDIGIIKGDKFIVDNKPIIVTTPQTLMSKFKNYNKEFYPKFRDIGIGLICFDECHQIANEWGAGTLLFNTPNLIGLSATPWHDKDKEKLMYGIFGEIVSEYTDYDFKPKYNMVEYDSGLSDKYGKRLSYLWENNNLMARGVYNKALLDSSAWIDVCVKIMVHCLKDEKNRMIVIVFTKAQMELLYDAAIKVGLEPIKFYAKQMVVDKEKDRLLIATQKYGSEAFSYKQLNRSLLAIPLLGKKSLVQSTGRLLRDCVGKFDVEVWDIYDNGKKFNNLFINTQESKIKIINNEYDGVVTEKIKVEDLN